MSKLDALLDTNLDDLSDLPTYAPYPEGVHVCTIEMEPKEINEKLAISINFKYVNVVELSDPAEKVPEVGDVANTLCQMDNEIGQGMFKKVSQVLAPVVGLGPEASKRAIIESTKGMTVKIVTKIRTNKDDATKRYLQLVDIFPG